MQLFWIFALFIIMGIFVPYVVARRKIKDYKQGRRKYSSLLGNLSQLQEHVETEADRWPIYARPVMFTDIDHEAQVEFARAQKTLQDANQIVPEIETIPEPETPENFDFRSLFHLPKNLRTIDVGNRLVGNVNSLENKVGSLTESVKTIRLDWYKAEKKRREVRQAVKDLKKRIANTNKNLKSIDNWSSEAINQVSWALSVAENCQLTAHTEVTKQSDEEQGYLEHAIADVYIEIGDFALECIDLFLDSQLISPRYDLDLFTSLFKNTTDYLQSILVMGEWNGWRKLQRAKPYIDRFPEIKEDAVNSLDNFKEQRQLLETLIKRINELDLARQVEKTNDLQNECTYYWYSFEERRSDWIAILRNHPLPSIGLNKVQSELVTDILPATGVDMVIKQSIMPQLITKINRLLKDLEVVLSVIQRLEVELNRHKEAQKIVNAQFSTAGAAFLGITRLNDLMQDTSPDITEMGADSIKLYQTYHERAIKVRGANFPDLKENIDALVVTIQDLINQHTFQLAKLESSYEQLFKSIQAYVDEIDKYRHHTPAFDAQNLKVFANFYDSGWGLLHTTALKKYSWLTNTTSNMTRWLQLADPYVVRAREKYQAFITARSQAEKQFRQTKEQIDIQRLLADRKWGWVQQELVPIIEQTAKELDSEIKEWKRHEERKWAELNIHQAIARCESQVKFADQLLIDLTKKTGKIIQQHSLLTKKANDIKEIARTNSSKLSEEEHSEITSLITLATRVDSKETVETLLTHANSVALKRADWRERKAIQKIIINSGGGTVVMGDVKTNGDFVGRDQKVGRTRANS